MRTKQAPLVEVEWLDASSTGNWRNHDDAIAHSTLADCRSAGYLLHRDKQRIVIAQNHDGEDKWSDTMAIPTAAVRRVRRLKR